MDGPLLIFNFPLSPLTIQEVKKDRLDPPLVEVDKVKKAKKVKMTTRPVMGKW